MVKDKRCYIILLQLLWFKCYYIAFLTTILSETWENYLYLIVVLIFHSFLPLFTFIIPTRQCKFLRDFGPTAKLIFYSLFARKPFHTFCSIYVQIFMHSFLFTMSSKISDKTEKVLMGAWLLRDRALKSILEIYIIATKAKTDESFRTPLEVHVRQLNVFTKQFCEQDATVHSLVQLKRVNSPETDPMESASYEIITIASPVVSAQPVKATVSNSSHRILPKIELPKFDDSITNWISFRDIRLG